MVAKQDVYTKLCDLCDLCVEPVVSALLRLGVETVVSALLHLYTPRTCEEEIALAGVLGQRRRPFELLPRLAVATQPAQQIAADGREQVITLQRTLAYQ